ncbi:MAG: archaemetzincin [Planctomycetota bacterium]|jgi:archaemetzincin|nr:archaemetzincin [Planctomycetota bacterium]
MRNAVLFAILLATGMVLSAWMGIDDSRRETGRAANLNTSQRRPPLKEGEILIWDPGSASPPAPRKAPAGGRAAAPNLPVHPAEPYAPIYEPAFASHPFYQGTRQLIRLARRLGAPRPDDWRSLVREPEQDFGQFVRNSRRASGALVIQPIGDLPADQRRAVGHILDSLSAFFGMRAVCSAPIPLAGLPPQCFRTGGGVRQINAEALMALVLGPLVEGDVCSVIAVTNLDIYPGGNWPFAGAFGWSSFESGTAVVSTAMILDRSRADRGRNLLRLTKLALHEATHTFGLKHCSRFNCLMNGTGNIRESDAKTLALCPDCLAKLSLVTGRGPELHIEDMFGLCRAKGFSGDARYYQLAMRLLKS